MVHMLYAHPGYLSGARKDLYTTYVMKRGVKVEISAGTLSPPNLTLRHPGLPQFIGLYACMGTGHELPSANWDVRLKLKCNLATPVLINKARF